MSIRKHLPPAARDGFTNLQVKMETVIVEEVKLFMKLDEVSWNDLLTACFKAYLDESRITHAEKIKDMREAGLVDCSGVPLSNLKHSQAE